MTEISFHLNAPEPLAYVCRLVRKALGSGAKLVLTGPASTLARLDQALWTFSVLDFVPHCFADAPAQMLQASPVVLVEAQNLGAAALPHHQVLVNVGTELPAGFESFERLIEVVAAPDVVPARQRWKHYTQRGYAPQKHEVAAVAN